MSSILETLKCPHCGHQGLQMKPSSTIYLYCSACNKKVEVNDIFPNTGLSPQIDYKIPNPILFNRMGYQSPLGLGSSFSRRIEISDNERKSLYFKTFFMGFIAFAIFYVCLGFIFPLKLANISWILLIGLFIVSRIADIISTKIGLILGGTETNPSSDPYDIGKLMSLQVVQIFSIIGISFLLGWINPWLQNGILFIFSLVGFEAFFANLGQVFAGPTVIYGTPNSSDMSSRMYTAHVISILLVAAIFSALLWIVL